MMQKTGCNRSARNVAWGFKWGCQSAMGPSAGVKHAWVSVGSANQHWDQTGGVKHGEGSRGGDNQHKGHMASVKHGQRAKRVEGVLQGCQSALGSNGRGSNTPKQAMQIHSNDSRLTHLSCRCEMVSLESALTWLVITTRPSSSM